MSNNIKFWLISTILMTVLSITGFVMGVFVSFGFSRQFFGYGVGLEQIGWLVAGMIAGMIGWAFGLLTAFIFIRRLGKRWGSKLNFGQHPVLKLTGLAFVSFLIISFILMLIFAKLPIK